MLEFYEAGARERPPDGEARDLRHDRGRQSRRGAWTSWARDGTGQTVVAWPPTTRGRCWVLLAADVGDARVAEILEALGSR